MSWIPPVTVSLALLVLCIINKEIFVYIEKEEFLRLVRWAMFFALDIFLFAWLVRELVLIIKRRKK